MAARAYGDAGPPWVFAQAVGETILVSLARDIITRRIAANWTRKEFARRAGVRPETISRLESGRHRAQRETLARIDAVLNRAGRDDHMLGR